MSRQRKVLVVGGARRLGAHLVRSWVGPNAKVAFSAHRSQAAADRLVDELSPSGAVRWFAADLTSVAQVRALAGQAVDWLGGLDLLIYNAGTIGTLELEDLDATDLEAGHALHQRAPYLLTLSCVEPLRAASGSVVLVASVGGLRPYAKHLAYSVTKAGEVMLARALAKRLAPEIRVNAVAPGTLWIEGEEEESVAKPAADGIPMQRYGSPADVAAAVRYLDGAKFVTGAVLPIDGGAYLK